MSTIFIGGSRHVSRLSKQVRERLDNVMRKGHDVVVGDADGADKAVQKLLHEADYRKVTVYCSGNRPRNNLGQWGLHAVTPPKAAKGFQFYAAKDREMAQAADFGLMIWDGKSPGTVLNVLRLVRAGKPAVLVNGAQPPITLKSASEWKTFLAACSDELRANLRSRATADEWQPGTDDAQRRMFDPPSPVSRVAEPAAASHIADAVEAPPTDSGAPKAAAKAATSGDGASKYQQLSKQELVRLLTRRDTERQLGLVWERDDIDADTTINEDFVALDLDPALSHGEAPWRNLIIEGDNYDALRALRMSHAGNIRCIYIDPPYNTGNRDFVYNDRFIDKSHRFRHSLWLEFMYKRLRLAKDLLADDGVIFVSIDDNELFRLGMLMDEVFGNDGQVATCVWQKRYSRENRGAIGDAHEYLLVFSRDPAQFKRRRNLIPPTERQAAVYKNPNTDPNGPWQSISMTAQGFRPNQMYEIIAPNGNRHLPPEGRCWGMIESEYLKLIAAKRIYFGKDGNGVPRVIRYLKQLEGIVPWTWWPHEEVGHTDEARKEIQSIFGTQTAFDTPKPVRLIERVLQIALKPDDTVLDFFAGSGTTAHAVAKLNAEDGGERRFILVSSTEATEQQPDKNLCRDVCAERVRRVMGGYTNTKGESITGLGGGFAYLRARRIPPHRLSLKLEHAEVWQALQLLHQRPLSPWPNHGFAADGALAYLADFREAHVARLRDWLTHFCARPCARESNSSGPSPHSSTKDHTATIYCWAPDRVRELAPQADWQPIPQALRARFGR